MAGWWEKYKKDRNLGGNKNSSSEKTGLKKEVRVTDENRQTARSSTWWEDYKKKRDLDSKAASSKKSGLLASANRQLEQNRNRDAAEDEIRRLTRNPFSSDAEWEAGVLQRNAERYKRDLPLYQQAMQNSSTWGEYFSAHRQAGEAQSAVKHQFERYQQASQKAEQDRNESNLVNRPALYASEHMTPEQISAELDRLRSGAATPTVTDKDRNDPVYAYLYPEAALKKVPHGARFDERLLEGAGQDAIDALYRPILTEQEKAAVEEADRKIIEDKANRNYERVQILKAAQSMQTERTSRETGNQLMEEIATGGAAAKQVEAGRAAFEAKQQQIASETSFEIGDDLDSNRGAYNKMQKERRKRGYIMGADWDNVPEARKQAVYALYAKDPEKAMELAKYYIADARQAEDEERQAWYAQSGWTAALGLVSSAAAHLGAAVDPFGDVGQELTRRGDNALAGGSQWADAATGYQKIPEWVPVVGGKGAGDLYQTVGSVVQSAAVAAPAILAGRYDQAAAETIGKLGLALMGSSAAASDYRESVAAGMDEGRAKLHALAAGVEEALFEEVSLDKLIKMDTSGGLKSALKNWLVQSGVEGSEELATSIANRITDELISGAGQSKVERRASELIANGMSATQAKQQAESEWMTDTLYEGFSGFLSGGMMTGGNYALQGLANLTERSVNAAETRKAQKQAGAAVSRSEGSVEALQAYAKDNGIEIKAVETAEQNTGESTEQGSQAAKQNSYSSRDYRSISDTNSKVVKSIRSEVRGKTAQEQQAIRDSLVEKYGEGIAPAVYIAISIETASRVRQEYGDVDSILTARNQAVSEIKDESLRRAVSDGYDSAAKSLAASQGGEDGMNTLSRYIQQRNNSGTGEMSMNATVTAQDGSTKTIAITGMSEDGKRVSLADGSEVAVKDLQADADTTSAIQQLADLDLGADATKVLQAYQQSGVTGTEGYRWLMDYATAYNQGRTRRISLEQAAQRSSLDERTVMDAYTLGQQAANRETLAGLEKLKNLPKRKGASGRTANIDTTEIKGKTMSKSELEQFALANQYAQALGVDVKWFSSKKENGRFVGKNGEYENGAIYMDIHAGRNFISDLRSGILATIGHELTHFQQQYAPEEYQALKEFLFEQIVKSSPNGEARLERLIWEKQRRSGNTLSRKAAEDEVVADACQKMLRDSKTVHDFASQHPEAANGVVRWLDKWFKRVRSIFGRGGNYSEEAQLMDSLEQDVKAAFGELWDKALKQAVQVHDEVGNIEKPATESETKEESKAQFSERDYSTPSDEELLMNADESTAENKNQLGLLKEYKALGKRSKTLQDRLDALNKEKADREASGKKYKEGYLKIKNAEISKLESELAAVRDAMEKKILTPQLFKLLEAERNAAAKEIAAKKDESFRKYKERKAATDLRGRISALKKDLQKSLLHPTDTNYVPAGLAKSIVDALDALDTSPKEGTKSAARYAAISDKLRAVAVAYNDMHTDNEVGYEYTVEYDQELAKMISDLAKTMEGRNARDLSADELKTVYDYLRSIRDTMVEARKLLSNLRYESVREAIASGLEQQSKITPIDDVSKMERKKRLGVMNKRSPMRAVEFMSDMDRSAALYEAFQQVEAGDEQRLAWSLAYQNDFRELKSGKNEKTYWQALTKQIDYGATDKKTGKPVTMTKMQAIQIFMTAQREAANKNLEHFFKGGATIRNAKDIMEGKGNIRSNEVFVTPELLKNIENSFTEWDREYMSRMRDYLKREGKAVNNVFYKLKHRVLALEENYVPTIVDQKYLDAKLETTDFSGLFVKSPRSTKPITEGAPQPLIIDGMETMMNKHVQEQAQYIGMATAIRDFAKIFNGKASTDDNGVGYTSLKAEIERNFGKEGVHLITQALIDIQGGSTQSGWKSGLEDFLKKLQTSFVRHALLFNLSVTIKQAASYVAAGSIISREALLKGNRSILNKNEASHSASLITQIFLNPNGKTAQKIFARADKYTALHADRRNGMNFAEIELGQKNYGKLRQKAAEIGANLEQKKGGHKVREIGAALNPASWIQRMDVATTAALFVACEYQARMDGLEGEAYHAKVKELYERVLRETQPMYDSLHRTAQQKSGGSLAQYLFPFRTVPIQNHGQMASAYDRLLAAKTKSDTEKAEAAKFFRKTLIAQIESAVVFSAMTFAAALTKRKTKKYRDEDGELTLESVARGFGLDVASTLVSVASPMWGSELWSLSDRFINKLTGKGGYTYDSFSVGAVDMINDTAAAIDRIAADVGKAMRRENVSLKEFGTHLFSLLTKVGNLSGIPADTIKTYTEGFIGNIQDAIEGRIPALNDESWERDAATNARRYLKAYLNNDTKKASAVLAELRSNLSKSGKDEGKINEAIRKYVSAQAVEKVADGTWTEEEAEAYLLSTGAYDDRENPQKDAWNAIRKGVEKSTSTDEEFKWNQYDDLTEAVANGEDVTDLLTEYRNHGYSNDQINGALRSSIQEALTAGDFDEKEAADALIRYGVTYSKDGKAVAYDEQTAWKKVQEWIDKAEHTDEEGELEDGYKYSAYADLFDAVDANQDADGIIQEMVQNGGYDTDGLRSQIKEHLLERFIAGQITETALKNQLSRYCKITKTEDANEIVKNAKCKRDFGVSPDGLREAFKDGDLSQNQAEKALQQYKGLSKTDAQNRVQYWGYDGDLSENAWTKWAHELKSTGLSVDNWEKVYKVKSSAKGTDANGDGRADSGTVKAEVVSYIDSMNIPKSQKKAIYLAFGWAASTMPSWR